MNKDQLKRIKEEQLRISSILYKNITKDVKFSYKSFSKKITKRK